MASLSLPRVLQLKKNSLDAEREQFEKFQTLAIQKAINSIETPVKEKHVRSTIIGTFQEQSAITYWMVAIRLPLQDNRIVAWKFCHVTHKLLREGHPACLDDSQRHIGMIENLGKLWVHLREGYGKLVHLYCTLLVCKIKFHSRNPRFPPNLSLTAEELDAIAENDVNNYFQLCVELFDYMDDILNLQAAVFDSLGNARANSMTASGQCRLAALIPCAQDSSQIYDCNVRLLFRLHASLPPDTLAGHRERFRQQFKKLSSFYKHASSLQYYRNLLTLPVLPSNPPNFLQQSDFGTYVAPVVSIPEPSPDEPDSVASLIDTSDNTSQISTPDQSEMFDRNTTPSPQSDPIVERDRLIEHLQNELKRMRSEMQQMMQERNSMTTSMRDHCMKIESQMQMAKTELETERRKAEMLSAETPQIKQKLAETEEKAKLTDEKFQKLKSAYTQLREEHIALIRQKAEVVKLTTTLRAAAAEHESAKMALQQQLNDKTKDAELLQRSASSSEEIEAYKNELANLRTELEQARQKELQLETLKASMEALEIEHNTSATESEEKLNIIQSELRDLTDNLQTVKKEKEDRELELSRVKEELVGVREKSGEEFKRVVEEKDAALKQIAELNDQYTQEKQAHETRINDLQTDLTTLQLKLSEVESQFVVKQEKTLAVISDKNKQFDEAICEKDEIARDAVKKLAQIEKEFVSYKENHENNVQKQEELLGRLQNEVTELSKCKEELTTIIDDLKAQIEETEFKLIDEISFKETLQSELMDKENEMEELLKSHDKFKRENEQNVFDKTQELNNVIKAKEQEIVELRNNITEIGNTSNILISELKATVETKSEKIQELNNKINEFDIETLKRHFDTDTLTRQYQEEITNLKDKLQTALNDKQEIIDVLKKTQCEKDNRIIEISVEAKSLANDVAKLEDDLNERNAELEITKNELLSLKDEYEDLMAKNEENHSMNNNELRQLHEENNKLSENCKNLLAENIVVSDKLAEFTQVSISKTEKLEEELRGLKTESINQQSQKDELEMKLREEIKILISDNETMKMLKESEIEAIKIKMAEKERTFDDQLIKNDMLLKEKDKSIIDLTEQLCNLEVKNKESQSVESRLGYVEKEKLNAECELQDLLQHNTSLEDTVEALKQQLEDAQKEILKQRETIVSCAGDAALQVTKSALASLDGSSSEENSKATADLAATAFGDLSNHTEVTKDAETIAKSAILAAHSTAQLSSYVTEVANTATDLDLSNKLITECRSLLSATEICMESLKSGSVFAKTSSELSKRVLSVMQDADRSRGRAGATSVDDELADMDRAIEEAAGQIEQLLATSRKDDSGIKLEVNEKILDACTTLMAAVKILVQDARKLQNELGDPKTRQKMYRRNPQWSNGLISAAKAVVFAAKLLVTSSDEAVACGRVEGVSAAAHEVAGSTAQLVAASRSRAPPTSPALVSLAHSSRSVAAATAALVAAVRHVSHRLNDQEALDTSALTLTATRRLEMESKVRSLELETALEAERVRLAALRKRHYHLAQQEENGDITNGKA